MKAEQSITVRFEKAYDVTKRVTLIERLQRIHGVIAAVFDSSDHAMLAVNYRDGCLSPSTLLDFLKRQGMHADLVNAGSGTTPA